MSAAERPRPESEPTTPTVADRVEAEGDRARHGEGAPDRREPVSVAELPGPEPEPATPTVADRVEAEGSRARHDNEGASVRPEPVSAQDARQGQVVLNTPVRRWVFFSGLAGLVILALLFAFF